MQNKQDTSHWNFWYNILTSVKYTKQNMKPVNKKNK